MKTDIEIAQEAELLPIGEVAEKIGIDEKDLEYYGKYKAKLSDELWEEVKNNQDGKLVLVTAINPTPAGEGKTTTTVGLGEAMGKLGKKAAIALREPSLGPCFGIKGGAAGGDKLAIKDLDIGGLIVTIHRLLTDTKYIHAIKEEFVISEFNKLIRGNDLNLKEMDW